MWGTSPLESSRACFVGDANFIAFPPFGRDWSRLRWILQVVDKTEFSPRARAPAFWGSYCERREESDFRLLKHRGERVRGEKISLDSLPSGLRLCVRDDEAAHRRSAVFPR